MGGKLARKALVIYNTVNQSNDFAKLEGLRDEKGAHERWDRERKKQNLPGGAGENV